MNEDEHFINELRSIKVAPMPEDLRKGMFEEARPTVVKHHRFFFAAAGIAAAACIMLLLNPWRVETSDQGNAVAINILHIDSTLLSSTTIQIEEVDGVYHEIVEEEWLDELSARSSTCPLEADSVVVRHERVRVPIKFL